MERVQYAKKRVPITYMIFDVLYYNGKWMTERSLKERTEVLSDIIIPGDHVQVVSSHHDGDALFKVIEKHEMEGIVVKDLSSQYAINGKDKRWQKKKVLKDLYAVVGGVTYRSGLVNALLLGLYDEHDQLWYIGHAGAGKLTQRDWRRLTETVQGIRIQERPFVNVPERNKVAIWIKPELTVKINFLNWTRSKTLRQPSIQSLVNVSVKDCTFGQT